MQEKITLTTDAERDQIASGLAAEVTMVWEKNILVLCIKLKLKVGKSNENVNKQTPSKLQKQMLSTEWLNHHTI